LTDTGFTIPPKPYDFLKFVALVILPAVAALVLGLGVLLNWSDATVVAGVITLVDTFLGTILGKSASNYKQNDPKAVGELVFGSTPEGGAEIRRVSVNEENPVFNAGSKVYLNVVREVDRQ
jgi:hypothetical protein